MHRLKVIAAVLVLGVSVSAGADNLLAQPAKGAPGAFERVREVMTNRIRDLKLTGDPDKDFAAVLAAEQENLVFLAKTQLEYGGDRQLRDMAQAFSVDGQKRIDELKQWQFRSRQADYKAQPDQPPSGSGPLDRGAQAAPTAQAVPAAPHASTSAAPAQPLPFVKGKIEDLDAAQRQSHHRARCHPEPQHGWDDDGFSRVGPSHAEGGQEGRPCPVHGGPRERAVDRHQDPEGPLMPSMPCHLSPAAVLRGPYGGGLRGRMGPRGPVRLNVGAPTSLHMTVTAVERWSA